MKKIISTVAALAVVAAMGATAMAAGLPSPSTTADITVEPVSLDSDYYEITASALDDDYLADLMLYFGDDLGALISDEVGDTEVAAVEFVDLTLTNKTTDEDVDWSIDMYNPITVAFAFDDAQNVIAVLTFDDDTFEWIAVDFEIDGDEIIATLNELYAPVIFVTKAVKADEPSKDDGKGSAQTGYDTVVYAVATIALAAGAVFFFATSKKTAKDVK